MKKELIERIGYETIYLRHPTEDVVFKILPDGKGSFAKFKKEKEFRTDMKNNLLFEAVGGEMEISESEYKSY